ncbi:MAG: ABC transporter substrate-binding protein [Tissierellia bacterium]|nr:ABC transporter substrate-binding protein [Tissierellia bacterium]
MKSNIIKKLLVLSICIPMIFTGCSSADVDNKNENQPNTEAKENENKEEDETQATDEQFTIGIAQLVEHPALDASRQGFIDELKNLGVKVTIEEKSAQGDVSNAKVIAEKFVKDDVDLIFSIATLTAQATKKAIEGTDIPMVFTAVTDPVYSQLVTAMDTTDNNITGVVDAAPIKEDLQLFKDLKEDTKTIGIIYNTGESNSEVQVNQTTEIAKELGLTIEAVGITSVNDIAQAVDTISKKADGLYIITDNLVASSISLVANLAQEKNLITISADGTHVDEGIMVSKGISYYGIGKQSAVIAKQILIDKVKVEDIPVQAAPEFDKRVNVKVAEALGFTKDNKAFEDAEFVE